MPLVTGAGLAATASSSSDSTIVARRAFLADNCGSTTATESSLSESFSTLLGFFDREDEAGAGEELKPFMNDLVVLLVSGEDASSRVSSSEARGVGSISTSTFRFFFGFGESSMLTKAARSRTAAG